MESYVSSIKNSVSLNQLNTVIKSLHNYIDSYQADTTEQEFFTINMTSNISDLNSVVHRPKYDTIIVGCADSYIIPIGTLKTNGLFCKCYSNISYCHPVDRLEFVREQVSYSCEICSCDAPACLGVSYQQLYCDWKNGGAGSCTYFGTASYGNWEKTSYNCVTHSKVYIQSIHMCKRNFGTCTWLLLCKSYGDFPQWMRYTFLVTPSTYCQYCGTELVDLSKATVTVYQKIRT